MKQQFITRDTRHRRLILFFAGWGMDMHPFARLRRPGYDIMLVSDYRDDGFDRSLLTGYDEIVVIAWSFGVSVADRLLPQLNLPITAAIAVNGTPKAVDDTQGIPRRIFALTLRTLSDKSVDTFNRRMCGDLYDTFAREAPQRSLDDLRDELVRFDIPQGDGKPQLSWSTILVSRNDAIISADNQLRAWGEENCTVDEQGEHYVDFQRILDRYVVAKDVVTKSFRRHATTYDAHAGVQARVARRLHALLSEYLPDMSHCHRIIEIGSGTGLLTRLYVDRVQGCDLRLWDISGHCPDIAGITPQHVHTCDAELALRELPDDSVDLILSSATLQWFNDFNAFLRHTERVLTPGGIAAFAYFLPGTCAELTSLTGNSLSFPTLPAADDCTVCAMTEDIVELFDSPADVLKHMRMTGVNSLGTRHSSNADIRRIIEHYPRTPQGKAPLTYRTAYLILKKNG